MEHARQEGGGSSDALSRLKNDAVQGRKGELHAHLRAVKIQVSTRKEDESRLNFVLNRGKKKGKAERGGLRSSDTRGIHEGDWSQIA